MTAPCPPLRNGSPTTRCPTGEAHAFFRDKLARDLVLLSDEDFTWFAKNATVVEPRNASTTGWNNLATAGSLHSHCPQNR